ncbi:MAG: hypothetical protein SFV54_02750 [Bryobacteraceae bacterium]|nr:hypothetical protein [Bryobacteraceae bacterium]
MHIRILTALALAAFSLHAQPQAPQMNEWYSHIAYKVKPGMGEAFVKHMAVVKKFAQSRKDAGQIKNWGVYRVIAPTGATQDVDYVTLVAWPKRAEIDPDVIAKMNAPHWQKAGTTQQQWVTQLNELATVVRTSVTIRRAEAGTHGVGDLLRVDYIKISPGEMGEYLNRERSVYKPVHEARIKDGGMKGWALHTYVFPAGEERVADAFTIQTFTNSDQMFGGPGPAGGAALFVKVHPNANYLQTVNRQNEIRKIVRSMALKHIDGL